MLAVRPPLGSSWGTGRIPPRSPQRVCAEGFTLLTLSHRPGLEALHPTISHPVPVIGKGNLLFLNAHLFPARTPDNRNNVAINSLGAASGRIGPVLSPRASRSTRIISRGFYIYPRSIPDDDLRNPELQIGCSKQIKVLMTNGGL